MANANQIMLSGEFEHAEDTASEAITPGHLVEVHTSSGRKLRKHATAKGFAERAFALEDAYQGNTISDAYGSGDRVFYALAKPGAKVQAWLEAGADYAIGDKLVSAGDGTLQKTSSSDLQVVAIVEEAVDLSASGAVATRCDVRIV
jgi:hypothetical protein